MVEIIAENHFKGLNGELLKENNGQVEVRVKITESQNFTYVGKSQDIKAVETV